MNVWCHLPTITNRRFALRIAGLLLLSVALITTLFFANISNFANAAPGTNKTINFQGRLLTASGASVPDGHYNIQFKIYQDGTGTAAGNPDGELQWTETYINNGSNGGVEVKNGYLSVNLGSVTPFGTSVDWNEDTLWLSMNVAGASPACTTFNTSPCGADGEMLPMKRLTATPYAINSGMLNGKTADNFIQLAQGVQADASTNTSSIHINKTGTGNIVQLQNAGTDVFTVNQNGDLALGSNADKSISIDVSTANTAGRQLSLTAGAGGSGTGADGGDLLLQGGAAGGTNGNGGDIAINAGAKTGTGTDGTIAIGTANTSSVIIGADGSATASTTTIQAKNAVSINTNGTTRATFSDTTNTVYFGNGVSASAPNNFTIQGTNSSTTAVAGGSLTVQGGNATTGDANGGNVTIAGGTGSGTGANGLVVLTTPTFSTVNNDANCYTGGANVADDCTIALTSVNNSSAIIVGFSETDHTATLPDPTILTAGRVMYIMASGNTEAFTLAVNGGGANNEITMRANSALTLLWNGSDWVSAGGSNSTTLQDAYTNATNTSTGPEIVLSNNPSANGLTIRDSATTPVAGTLLNVKNSSDTSLFSVNDNLADGIQNIQVGDGTGNGPVTVFTLDKSDTAPTITDQALLGSMYYDTTLGQVQCYEAEGWGACGSSPDTFVSMSPEFANTVVNGPGIGTFKSDFCSDTLNINGGTSPDPAVCGTDETYNFYSWTSTEGSAQTRSLYVTYQLPENFKEFVPESVSLMGRTDSIDASVTYQLYRKDSTGALTACGTTVNVSTGNQTSWQKGATAGNLASCNFEAGDSIMIKINVTAFDDANAYVSDLKFAFSNK